MTYISNTITDPNAPSAMCTAIEVALSATGYTLSDTVVISTRTHRIWKNPAANNSSGKDWYLDLAYTTTSTGTFGIYVMEGYDPATDLASRMAIGFPYYSSTSLSMANNYSPYGATGYSLESTQWVVRAGAISDNSYSNRDVSLPASSFGYWVSVTTERVVSMFSVSPTIVYYSGLFEPAAEHTYIAGAYAFPLVSAAFSGNGAINAGIALTRFPKITGAVNGTAAPLSMNIVNLLSIYNSPSIPSGNTDASRKFALRIPFYSNANSRGVWGYFIDVAAVWSDAIVTRGDTISDDSSAVWVLSAGASNASIMMKRV
ncbi:MAG: hypothetical protein V4611_02415 [Patescibacteria group bacterium]